MNNRTGHLHNNMHKQQQFEMHLLFLPPLGLNFSAREHNERHLDIWTDLLMFVLLLV